MAGAVDIDVNSTPSMLSRSTKLSPSSPVASAPSRSATVCPRSENEPLVPSTGPPEAGRQERRPLARMVGGRGGGVAPRIAGEQQHTPVESGDQLREPPVERLDAGRVAVRVVAVSVFGVEVHEVREDERRRRPTEVLEREIHPVVVGVRVPPLGDPLAREDVLDLAHAEDGDPGLLQPVEHRRAGRRNGRSRVVRGSARRRRADPRTAARSPDRHGAVRRAIDAPLVTIRRAGAGRPPTCASRSGTRNPPMCRRSGRPSGGVPPRARR